MMRHVSRHLSLFALLGALMAPVAAQGLIGDYGAGSATMFRSTGPHPSMIGVRSQAVLGKLFSVDIDADSRYVASALFVSNSATRGRPVLVGNHELLAYAGPAFWVPVVLLTGGKGNVSLQIPQMETLVGDDIAIQALSLTGGFEIGASNLLVANVGATALGPAIFGFLTTARHDPMDLDDWFKDNATSNPQPLEAFCNRTRSDSIVVVNLKTKRNFQTNESIEVWVGPAPTSATRVATITQPESTLSVRVPPGECLYFQHVGGNATLEMDYDLTGPLPFTSAQNGGATGAYHTYRDASSNLQPRALVCNVTSGSVKIRLGWKLQRALAAGEELELRVGRSTAQISNRIRIQNQQHVIDIDVPAGECVWLWHKGNASLGVDWEILKG